ncbi:MAG: ferrochelatase [Myxococcota bacterium]
MSGTKRVGVLLLNLGTPDSPSVSDVRRYLREFLSDPRVIDIPALFRWLLLRLFVLPFRPRRSARAYRSIWTTDGSPLLVHSRALRNAVAESLGGDYVVRLGMRYGSPSIEKAQEELIVEGVDSIIAFPLFPQFAESSTGSAVRKVLDLAMRPGHLPALVTLSPFYDHPGFIAAVAEVMREDLVGFTPDHVVVSFHGLPERQVRRSDPHGTHCLVVDNCCAAVGPANRDCYRAHCFATARALAEALELSRDLYTVSFQSRFGRTPWIGPPTDRVLQTLAFRGVRRVAVVCPSFVADCLETLEEIGIRGRETFRAAGGQDLRLVRSINAHPRWVAAVVARIRAVAERRGP